MTSLFTARRRAEELAAVVDGDPAAGAVRHPEVAELARVVAVLRDRREVVPRPEFADALRERLMVEARTVLTAENSHLVLSPRPRSGRERRLVAAASAVVLIGGTAGMAAAAQDALPGEALYPVKRVIERAEAGLSMSQAGKGRHLLEQATDRLAEVRGLVGEGADRSASQVPATLDEFTAQAGEGAALLLDSFQETRDPEAVLQVRAFAADGVALLADLAGSVPAEAQDELATAALTLRDLDERAAAMCDTCAAGLPVLEIPGMFLARSEVDRALEDVAGRPLDNSHPVVVPHGTVRKTADTAPEGTARPGPAPATTPADDPQPLQTPALPGSDAPVSGDEKTPGEQTGKVVEDLTDGLGGVVETLLPDTGLDDDLGALLP